MIGSFITVVDLDTFLIIEKSVNYDDKLKNKIKLSTVVFPKHSVEIKLSEKNSIERRWAQGFTQVFSFQKQENADSNSGLVVDFEFPDNTKYINKVTAFIRIEPLRHYNSLRFSEYSQQYESNNYAEYDVYTEYSEPCISQSSTDINIVSSSETVSGTTDGVNEEEYRAGTAGNIIFYFPSPEEEGYFEPMDRYMRENSMPDKLYYHTHKVKTVGNAMDQPDHRHRFISYSHKHTVEIPSHLHFVPQHIHYFKTKEHTHLFNVSHVHIMAPGIYFFGNPAVATVSINNAYVSSIYRGEARELDLTEALNSFGKIKKKNLITVRPSDYAYISLSLFVQCFIKNK